MAPEIIRREGYDQLVDWWSIGCLLYEFLVGFPPFLGDTPLEVFDLILDHENTLQFPESGQDDDIEMSPEARDLIKR